MARRRYPRPIVLLIKSSDPGWEEHHFATVTLTEGALRWYLKKIEVATKLREEERMFLCLSYFDYPVRYYTSSAIDDIDELPHREELASALLSEMEWGEDARLSTLEAWHLEQKDELHHTCRTECDQVAIYEDRIHYECVMKHTSSRLETEAIRTDELRDLLKEAALFDTN